MEELNVETTEQMQEQPAEEIKDQKDFNAALNKRLEKEREKQAKIWAEKYEKYMSPEDYKNNTEELNNKIMNLGNSLDEARKTSEADKQTISELQEKIAHLESSSLKTEVAIETGLPVKLANKLSGSTKEELTADAIAIMNEMKALRVPGGAPLRNPDANEDVDGVSSAFSKLNPKLKI